MNAAPLGTLAAAVQIFSTLVNPAPSVIPVAGVSAAPGLAAGIFQVNFAVPEQIPVNTQGHQREHPGGQQRCGVQHFRPVADIFSDG